MQIVAEAKPRSPKQRRNADVEHTTPYSETAEAASGEKRELGQRLGDFAHEIVSYGSFTCVWKYTDPRQPGVHRPKAMLDETDTNKRLTYRNK